MGAFEWRQSNSQTNKLQGRRNLFRATSPGGTSLVTDADYLRPAAPIRSSRPAASVNLVRSI
jgi:hypothetical protein